MKLHHYKSDFVIAVKLFKPTVSGEQEPVMIPGRIKIEFFTEGGIERISVERNGDSFSRCSLADGGKTLKAALPLSRHCVGTGDLIQVMTIYENDSLFPEGVKRVLSPKHTGVVLHAGASDDDNIVEIENAVSLVPKYCGVYSPSKTYDKDDIVTHKGSAFISTKTQSGVAPSVSWDPDHSSFVVNNGWELFAGVDMPFVAGALEELKKKADKDGYHCDMAVGKADAAVQLIDGKAAVADTASYRMRAAGGSKDIETGVSAITRIYGRTEKQYVKNGNFEVSEGWIGTDNTPSISKGLLSWISAGSGYNDARSSYSIRAIKDHKILIFGLSFFADNVTNGNIYTNPSAAGMNKAVIDTLSVKGAWNITGQICSYDASGDVRIILGSSYNAGSYAKIAWVKMYDLTELGLEHLTTVEQAAAYFGGAYGEGLQGSNLLAKRTTGFNQFSPAGRNCGVIKNYYIVGTAGENEGKIWPNAGSSVIYFPCVKSEVGSGKNNGYRIHIPGFSEYYILAGWNPFSYGEGGFDKAWQIKSVFQKDTIDYSANGDGYIYVSLRTTDDAVINKIIAHFKHSYTDFAKQYAEEAKYKLSSKRTPYGELHSIRDAKDEIDLVAKKKIQRIGVKILDGNEQWRKESENLYYLKLEGLVKVGTPNLNNHYGLHTAAIKDMQDKTVSWSGNYNLFLKDSDAASVEVLKSKLAGLHAAGTPVKVYYVLAEPVITDIEVGSNAQSINDFGTEELEYTGAMPEITTEYYNNLVDKLRNLPAPNEVAVVNPTSGENSALRALFVAAGAVYNKATGFYELNGLTDITEEQMIAIYNSSDIARRNAPMVDGQHAYSQARTLFSPTLDAVRNNIKSSGFENFYQCSKLEIIKLMASSSVDLHLKTNYMAHTFAGCVELRKVAGKLNVQDSYFNNAFQACSKLEEINLEKLSNNISFSDSPSLSNASILFMVKNAANVTKDITITLHPEAKTRIAGNAEIQQALTTNGHITII